MKNKIFIAILSIFVCISFVIAGYLQLHKQKTFNNALYPIQVGEKFGYIDISGKVISPPEFQEAKDFSEGLGTFKQNNKWGFLNSSGKIIINPQFEYAEPFSDGLALVLKQKKWGYIDKNGKYIISANFEMDPYEDIYGQMNVFSCRNFSKGLAAAMIDYKWGYIDRAGKFVIKPQYIEANSFTDEITVVAIEPTNNNQSGCFVIDKSGKTALDYNKLGYYNGVEGTCPISFSDGMMSVYSDKNQSYGYLDKTGKFVKTKVRLPNSDIWSVPYFSENLASYDDGYKYGFINKTGKIVIKPIFDTVYNFTENLAGFCNDNKCGFIDKTGNITIKPVFDFIEPFKNELAKAKIGNKEGYINKSGKFIWYQLVKESEKTVQPYTKKVDVSSDSLNSKNKNILNYYFRGLQKEILDRWEPQDYDVQRETVVKIKINRDGSNASQNNSYDVIKSSGSTEFDDSTWKAIRDPLEPLPDAYKGKYLNINIIFNCVPKNPKKNFDKPEKITQNQTNNEADTDFGPYMKNLQNKIKTNWHPPKGDSSKKVIVLFKLDKDGTVLSSKIKESSGDEETDNAALKAISVSSPFDPLPQSFKENNVDVQFTFDYNVFATSGEKQ